MKHLPNIPDEYNISYKIVSKDDEYTFDWKSDNLYKNGKVIYHDDDGDLENSNTDDFSLSTSVSNTNTEVTNDDKLAICWTLAEDVVKAKLKSPSSAKFPFSYADEDVSITKSGDTYTVKAWVEAENSFGATPRSDFTVTMTKSGSNFSAESCVIDE